MSRVGYIVLCMIYIAHCASNAMERLPAEVLTKILFHTLEQSFIHPTYIILVNKAWKQSILNPTSYQQAIVLINYIATIKKVPRATIAEQLNSTFAHEYLKKGTMLLACKTEEEIVRVIEQGADINFQNNTGTSLMFNVLMLHYDYKALKFLIAHGANPHITGAQEIRKGYASSTKSILELFDTYLSTQKSSPNSMHYSLIQCYELLKPYTTQPSAWKKVSKKVILPIYSCGNET